MYAESGVGLLDEDRLARHVEVLLADVAQPYACRGGDVHAELKIVADGEPFACGGDAHAQRLFGAHHVVLGGVFDEQLQAAGHHMAAEERPRNVDLDLEAAGETLLQQVDVFAGEFELLFQRHQLLVFLSEHVAVGAGQFADEGAGPFGLVLLHQAVEDVERIEQEVGVDLLLEPFVVELRPVLLAAFGAEFAVAFDQVDGQLQDGVDDDVDQQDHRIEPEEVAGRHDGAVALRQPEVDGSREQEHEPQREECRSGQPQPPAADHAGAQVDEDDVAADHGHQRQRIAQQPVEFGVDALLFEVGRAEKAGVEDAEQKDGRDAHDDLPGRWRPPQMVACLRVVLPGEGVGQPADEFGHQRRGDGWGRDAAPEQLLDELRAVDAEQIGHEDADQGQRRHQLDPQAAAHSDDEDHRERQDRQRHVVHIIEYAAEHRHGGVRRSEKVDEPRDAYRGAFHGPDCTNPNLKLGFSAGKCKFRSGKNWIAV